MSGGGDGVRFGRGALRGVDGELPGAGGAGVDVEGDRFVGGVDHDVKIGVVLAGSAQTVGELLRLGGHVDEVVRAVPLDVVSPES